MKLVIILLLSPAVFCTQRLRKSTDPNDEPFLPIYPQYPYSPKLMKRGLEQSQGHQQQPGAIPAQLSPELYGPKVDSRDSYTTGSYAQSPTSFYASSSSPYDALTKSSLSSSGLTASSPYYQSSYSTLNGLNGLNSSPYSSLLSSYGSPYGSSAAGFGLGAPGLGGVSPFAAAGAPGAPGAYPNPYSYYPNPYYYPGYYGQPGPYGPVPPPGYPGAPYKHPNDDEDDDEDDRRQAKGRKAHKNKLRNSDRDNQYVDGANYIISSAKDLDSESSTHRTPSHLNQIEDADVSPRAVILPKATYRLVSISGQPDNSGSTGYIKVQQLEQLMRQALAKLLAQNAAQQANYQQDQGKDGQQYLAVPNTIAKTGLSYVVNPSILNRVTPGQYNPSTLIQTLGSKPYVQKGTSVTLQQSPGIYIPPTKSGNDQSAASQDYGDYDSGDNVTTRPSITNYQATAEPTRNYPYSTYRPTQQTSLDDVNFGNKQKNKT